MRNLVTMDAKRLIKEVERKERKRRKNRGSRWDSLDIYLPASCLLLTVEGGVVTLIKKNLASTTEPRDAAIFVIRGERSSLKTLAVAGKNIQRAR